MKKRKKHSSKVGTREKSNSFHDLLIPVLLVLCVMPFVIHLAEYDFGYSKYLWHSDNSVAQDLYAYYRSYFFVTVCVFVLFILVFYMLLYREDRKWNKLFVLLAVYAILVIVSTIFSVNWKASVEGNYYQFQSVFVLLSYILICFYTFQIVKKESDYRILFYAIVIVFCMMAIIGFFQILKVDLLNFRFFQRLIMTQEQYETYAGEIDTTFTGNNVFLTLFNPNYAGVYLTMMADIFGVMCYSEKNKKSKIFYGILTIAAIVFMWFTYSRSTFLSLMVSVLVFCLILGWKNVKKVLIPVLLLLILFSAVFVTIDKFQGYKYLSRIIDTKKNTELEKIITKKDGIYVTYDDQIYHMNEDNDKICVYDSKGAMLAESAENEALKLPFAKDASMESVWKDDAQYLYLKIGTYDFMFGSTADGYYYLTENGKQDQLVDIKKIDMHGLEYLGSGRLYIWSRTMPLLKDYLIYGSGPDTFAEVYPQNDYVGKVIYANSGARIVEKPHNDFLLQWVQTGLLSVIALVAFYVGFIRSSVQKYRKLELDTWEKGLDVAV